MRSTWYMAQNDNNVPIRTELVDEDGNSVSLIGVTEVKFHMHRPSPANNVDGTATVVNAPGGVVQYVFQTADLAYVGRYRAEWQVTYAGGEIATFPNHGYDTVVIREEIS